MRFTIGLKIFGIAVGLLILMAAAALLNMRTSDASKPCKSANTSPVSARARARARVSGENQRPWPADKVERWAIGSADPVREKCTDPH